MSDQRSRLPRLNYAPRVAMYIYAGIAVLVATRGETYGLWFWPFWSAVFLIWPHLAYVRARLAADPKEAEYRNIAVDAVLTGLWAGICQYLLWAVFLFLSGPAITSLAQGGIRPFARVVCLYTVGAVLGGALISYRIDLVGNLADAAVGSAGGILVLSLVGFNFYLQNRHLVRMKQAVDEKNRIFESLIQMGVVTHQATEADDLVQRAVRHFVELMPEFGFGIVLHDPHRPASVRHAAFRGIPPPAGDYVMHRMREPAGSGGPVRDMEDPAHGQFRLLTLAPHLRQLHGVLVVRVDGTAVDADRMAAVSLFRDQFAAAMESHLLTLQLRKLASTDPLTCVFNRAYFMEAFEQAKRNRSGSAGTEFTVVAIDVNGLKPVNDNYGHEAGDTVILAAADMLRGVTRESDILVRMGGDEFVLLCNGCDSTRALQVAERIRAAERQTLVRLPGHCSTGIPLSVSIGYASSDQVAVEKLAAVADRRMYADKKSHYQTLERSR